MRVEKYFRIILKSELKLKLAGLELATLVSINCYIKVSCGAGAQSVTVKATGSGFDPHSRKLNIY